jgi:hypothetical protein
MKLTILLLLALTIAIISSAQTPTSNKYKLVGNTIVENRPTWDSTTTYKFNDINGKSLPVYKTLKGKLYVWTVSKSTNRPYKKYLKVD